MSTTHTLTGDINRYGTRTGHASHVLRGPEPHDPEPERPSRATAKSHAASSPVQYPAPEFSIPHCLLGEWDCFNLSPGIFQVRRLLLQAFDPADASVRFLPPARVGGRSRDPTNSCLVPLLTKLTCPSISIIPSPRTSAHRETYGMPVTAQMPRPCSPRLRDSVPQRGRSALVPWQLG